MDVGSSIRLQPNHGIDRGAKGYILEGQNISGRQIFARYSDGGDLRMSSDVGPGGFVSGHRFSDAISGNKYVRLLPLTRRHSG
jgi:hypothetical protein